MRILSTLLIAASAAAAGATYTATAIGPAGGLVVANIMGMNNKGEVLADVCNVTCNGTNRGPAVWSNGVFTSLPVPSGFSYVAQPAYYGINDSGTVVGTLAVAGTDLYHVFVWKNGVPSQLLDAHVPGACSPASAVCTCSPTVSSAIPGVIVGSTSFGINAAGHIVGATKYLSYTPGGQPCSGFWVYDGAQFHAVPSAVPPQCVGILPNGGSGTGVLDLTFNDADQVMETVQNFFCGPPFSNPSPPFAAYNPAIVKPGGSTSFLPLGGLPWALGTSINDAGDVLGAYGTNGSTANNVVIWDNNGVHALGLGGYAHMNNVGQVVYWTPSGAINIWQNGISTPVTLPASLNPATTAYVSGFLNDAGQFTVSGGLGNYLLTPNGPCAQDVTSQVKITPTGFRYNHSTGLFNLIGSVTNTSGAPIPGPISLVVDNLPASATLFNITGDTLCAAPQGSPYQDIGNIGAGQSLAPGASISGSINFIDTAQTGITYSLRVLAGPGGR